MKIYYFKKSSVFLNWLILVIFLLINNATLSCFAGITSIHKESLNATGSELRQDYDLPVKNKEESRTSTTLKEENKNLIEQTNEQKIYDEAVFLLRHAQAAKALDKLFGLLDSVGPESEMYNRINVSIAEGYRQQREFKKGLYLLYDVIKQSNINVEDLTHAYTRIAAIYNEGGGNTPSRIDSIFKYSDLAIANSLKHGFKYHLAISQNEQGFIYLYLKDYPKAIELLTKARENFLSLDMKEDAAHVGRNLCSAYDASGNIEMAEKTIEEALALCNPENNSLLFMRLYLRKAHVSAHANDYKTAYESLLKSRSFSSLYYNNRIDDKIAELTAKFENERIRKESELRLIRIAHKNKTIGYLGVGIAITFLLLIIIFYLFRKRTTAYKKLVEKNIALIEEEDKVHENRNLLSGDFKNESEKTNSVSFPRRTKLAQRFEDYIKDEKPYFVSHITIDEICLKLETNRTYLANAIKTEFGQNFNSYINEARVKEAMRFLRSPEYDNFSIEGIGIQVGFSNRISFNSNFKKVTGVSPSTFRAKR